MNKLEYGQSAYNLLSKISYERIGGTESELKALNTIKRHIKLNTKLEPEILEFEVDDWKINKVKFSVTKPKIKDFNVTAYGMCNSCDIEKELFFLENVKEIKNL